MRIAILSLLIILPAFVQAGSGPTPAPVGFTEGTGAIHCRYSDETATAHSCLWGSAADKSLHGCKDSGCSWGQCCYDKYVSAEAKCAAEPECKGFWWHHTDGFFYVRGVGFGGQIDAVNYPDAIYWMKETNEPTSAPVTNAPTSPPIGPPTSKPVTNAPTSPPTSPPTSKPVVYLRADVATDIAESERAVKSTCAKILDQTACESDESCGWSDSCIDKPQDLEGPAFTDEQLGDVEEALNNVDALNDEDAGVSAAPSLLRFGIAIAAPVIFAALF